jgi:hypothetical protein
MHSRRAIVAVVLALLLAPLATAADGAAPPVADDTALYVRALELAVDISYATAFACSMLTMCGDINGMDDDLYRGLLIGMPAATAVSPRPALRHGNRTASHRRTSILSGLRRSCRISRQGTPSSRPR